MFGSRRARSSSLPSSVRSSSANSLPTAGKEFAQHVFGSKARKKSVVAEQCPELVRELPADRRQQELDLHSRPPGVKVDAAACFPEPCCGHLPASPLILQAEWVAQRGLLPALPPALRINPVLRYRFAAAFADKPLPCTLIVPHDQILWCGGLFSVNVRIVPNPGRRAASACCQGAACLQRLLVRNRLWARVWLTPVPGPDRTAGLRCLSPPAA